MNWRNVRLIFLREVRDQVRDRRTLFMVVVLPLLLYPGLAIGMAEISLLFHEQPRSVVVLGTANLPAEPPLLNGDRFASNWFASPDDANKLHVITDQADGPSTASKANADLLARTHNLWPLVEHREELEHAQSDALKAENSTEYERLTVELQELRDQIAEQFTELKVQVVILVPRGFKEHIQETRRALEARTKLPAQAAASLRRPLVLENSADEKSLFAYHRVKDILTAWEHQILEEQLSQAKLPATLSTPVNPAVIDVAVARQLSASLWSKLFPTLLIIMAVTGAFYPAVDLAAGEKERGTMETLLICPAQRSEIVLGKFFTVLTFSVSTVLLNLASMGFTGKYLVAAARSEALSKMGGADTLTFPGLWEVLWLFVLLVPLAAFYSAVSLALATFARSTKEGQYYLTPLLLVTLGLTLLCLSPVVEIEPLYSILPVVGPALLLREVLASPGNMAPLVYAVPVLVSSVAYSLAGLWWAIAMFKREDVLFREAERFDLRLWVRHLMRDKEPVPSAAEAILCFVVIMLLQFVAVPFMRMRGGLITAEGTLSAVATLQLLLVQQMVSVACPALFMGILLTTSVVRTFRLRLPDWQPFAMACILPFAIHPLTIQLGAWLEAWKFFPPLPKAVVELMEAIGSPSIPFWMVLVSIAAAPAVCEELAFRGFILSGFARSSRPWTAILLSSVAFGVTHMIPQQVFNATLLGLLLGLFALRSGSILPGMVFHFLYNALELVRVRLSAEPPTAPVLNWLVKIATRPSETGLEYNWSTLAVSAIVAIVLIARLIQYVPRRKSIGPLDDPLGDDPESEQPATLPPPVASR